MRKSQFLLIAALLAVLVAGSANAATPPAAAGAVNINTADSSQLSNLPRVGAKAAQRVIDYRKEHGPFLKTTDLMQVKGFGEKTYERISPYLAIDGNTTLASKVQQSRKPRAARATRSSKPHASPAAR